VIETVIVVPVRDNEGRPFERALWDDLEERLFQFGGLTGPFEVRGAWQSGGRTHRDRNRQYTVALQSWLQLPAWLEVVQWARAAFRQEAMYIKVAGTPEIVTGVVP
jgi:hypothetical protein